MTSRLCVVISQRAFPETVERLTPHADVVAPAGGAEALSPDALASGLSRADAWMAFMPDRVDDGVLARAPRLKLVAGALKGGDNFNVAACTGGVCGSASFRTSSPRPPPS